MLDNLLQASVTWVAIGGAALAVLLIIVWSLTRRTGAGPGAASSDAAPKAKREQRDTWVDSSEITVAGADDEEDAAERSSTVPLDGNLVALSERYLREAHLERGPVKAADPDPAIQRKVEDAPAVAPDIEMPQHPSVSQTA